MRVVRCGTFVRAVSILAAAWFLSGSALPAAAQSPSGIIQGQVAAQTGAPVPDAAIVVEELGRTARTGPDGTFTIDRVGAGVYHVLVAAPGFTPARQEVMVGDQPAVVNVVLEPEIHYTEVVSVSPTARDQFESYQPTAVLAGQPLAINLQGTLGATLSSQAGVAERSLGPAPSRPVIRGLDGDRVLILEDGQRTGDLSSQSGDHGVTVNPASAQRIEVVRGPATLLYGANAIGGLVNVITDVVPSRPQRGVKGAAQFDAGSVNAEAAGAGDVSWGNERVALNAGGAARRTGEVDTPDGPIANSQSRSALAHVGGSYTTGRGFVGASYAYDDLEYGVPVVEEGRIQVAPRRHAVNVRAQASGFSGFFDSFRASVGYRDYRHRELEGAAVGTTLDNDSAEFELLANHRAVGRMRGTFGGWAFLRAFDARGEEALSPAVDQRAAAAFVYEELTWPHATMQFGARVDHTTFNPDSGPPSREFTNLSGSIGLLVRPSENTTVALNLARASRNPALEELYFFGPHPGNISFELGNPDLESEHALGFDASFRWRIPRFSGELTFFRNDIRNYIFRKPVDERQLSPGLGLDEAIEFPIVRFVGADSVLQGVEAHADVDLGAGLAAETTFDWIRGELKELGEPLPRIPPRRVVAGLRYQRNALQIGGQIVSAGTQDRVFETETVTDGYTLLKLYGAFSFEMSGLVNTITARLDNAANEAYRNHLSYIKDLVLEPGRSVRVVYRVEF